MLVDVVSVRGVPMSVVDVVDMIDMGHGHVPTAEAVGVLVDAVLGVGGRLAVVDMPVVLTVQVPVMDVVDVVGVRECDMTAAIAMTVGVIDVLDVGCCGHGGAPLLVL